MTRNTKKTFKKFYGLLRRERKAGFEWHTCNANTPEAERAYWYTQYNAAADELTEMWNKKLADAAYYAINGAHRPARTCSQAVENWRNSKSSYEYLRDDDDQPI